MAYAIAYDDIAAAHARIGAFIRHTPAKAFPAIDALTGAQVFFKCENEQRTGSFKARGAINAVMQLDAAQLQGGVIAYSAGNHASAIAYAAQLREISAVIVMPSDVPAIKLDATRKLGAEIVLYDRRTESREAISQHIAKERGMTLIPPFDHTHVMAGQGTIAKELFEQTGSLDILFVPLGGGGMLAGCLIAARELCQDCRVYGVEPCAGNDGQRSLREGRIVRIEAPDTMADGARTQQLGQLTFPIIRDLTSGIETVTEEELAMAMRELAAATGMVVEPTGCLGAAALLPGKLDVKGKRVGVVVSGGNVDPSLYHRLIAG